MVSVWVIVGESLNVVIHRFEPIRESDKGALTVRCDKLSQRRVSKSNERPQSENGGSIYEA